VLPLFVADIGDAPLGEPQTEGHLHGWSGASVGVSSAPVWSFGASGAASDDCTSRRLRRSQLS
jgi:hypothetical protein